MAQHLGNSVLGSGNGCPYCCDSSFEGGERSKWPRGREASCHAPYRRKQDCGARGVHRSLCHPFFRHHHACYYRVCSGYGRRSSRRAPYKDGFLRTGG